MMYRTGRRKQSAKLARRLALLDTLIDLALRTDCRFAFCDGPLAPIREHKTCVRCAAINRAMRMGLVKENPTTYVRPAGDASIVVCAGVLEQFSAVDGAKL